MSGTAFGTGLILFYFLFYFFLLLISRGSKNRGSMDPVHERGPWTRSIFSWTRSMDPVHGGGPWTRGPCFVLSRPVDNGVQLIPTCWSKSSQTILWVVSFRVPLSNVVYTKKIRKLTTSGTKQLNSEISLHTGLKTELCFPPFCLHRIFWCQTAGEYRIHLVEHINLRKKSSWNDPWQYFNSRLSSSAPCFVAYNLLISGSFNHLCQFIYRSMKVPNMRKYGERSAELCEETKLPWDNKEEVWYLVCNSVYH